VGRVRAWFAAAILPVVVAMVPASRVEAADPPLRIGLPESMFAGVPPSVVAPASKPFQSMFEKQTGLKGEIVVAKDYTDITKQLRNKTLDVAVFHGFEFAWVKQNDELVPLLLTIPGSKIQASLVVQKDSKANTAKDLKGDCIVIPKATKTHCRLYLGRLKEELPEGCCGTAKMEGASVEEALDALATGKCEAVLVDSSSLVGYQKNKPGVGTQLRVLAESDPFPVAVIVYRKEVFDAKTAAKVRDGFIKGAETPQGQLLTSLWRLKGFGDVTPNYLVELDKSLKAYPAPKK
jgi:ABC-type phosphate/phosphonate transport system substrate-binding protein